MQSRMVICARISVMTDESTSLDRQVEAGKARAALEDGKIVGYAEDKGVSANKFAPAQRPGLKRWLLHDVEQFDTLVFWKLDRLVRSPADFHWVLSWAKENRKRILLCEKEFGAIDSFDYRNVGGRGAKGSRDANFIQELISHVISWVTSLETDKLSERVTSTHDYLRKRGEWGGGIAPYGFIPQRIPKAKRGFELVPCKKEVVVKRQMPDGEEEEYTLPPTWPVLRKIIDDLFAGQKLNVICNRLNAAGHMAPRDWWGRYRGRDSQNRLWHYPTVKKLLQNRILLGEVWHASEPEDVDEENPQPWKWPKRRILDEAGKPVQLAEAMLTASEFTKLQEILEENSMGRVQRYEKPNHFLGVARCARCGQEMYYKENVVKGKKYQDFVCRSKNKKDVVNCGQPAIASPYVEHVIKTITLSLIGEEEVRKRHFILGDDKSEEKAQLEDLVRQLEDEKDEGLILNEARYLERKRKYIARLREIGENPVREARFEWSSTGKTYSELWSELEPLQRLEIMNALGIRVYLGRAESAAAEAAWENQGRLTLPKLPIPARLAASFNEDEVNEMLEELNAGMRIKKDFKVWYLQEASAFPAEILEQLAVSTS